MNTLIFFTISNETAIKKAVTEYCTIVSSLQAVTTELEELEASIFALAAGIEDGRR